MEEKKKDDGQFDATSRFFGKELDRLIKKADDLGGEMDYLQYCISSEIDNLQELMGETCERLDRLQSVTDLNHKLGQITVDS